MRNVSHAVLRHRQLRCARATGGTLACWRVPKRVLVPGSRPDRIAIFPDGIHAAASRGSGARRPRRALAMVARPRPSRVSASLHTKRHSGPDGPEHPQIGDRMAVFEDLVSKRQEQPAFSSLSKRHRSPIDANCPRWRSCVPKSHVSAPVPVHPPRLVQERNPAVAVRSSASRDLAYRTVAYPSSLQIAASGHEPSRHSREE